MAVETLHELFEYRDGDLYWRKQPPGRVHASLEKPAGYINNVNLYRYVHAKKKNMLVHRIVYALHYGLFPEFVDHIDNNRQNNRIENLRACTRQQNQFNRRVAKNNTSGKTGVAKLGDKWSAQIRCTTIIKLGVFDTYEEAVAARVAAEKKYQGDFAYRGADHA